MAMQTGETTAAVTSTAAPAVTSTSLGSSLPSVDSVRLWVGNIDRQVAEYQLLQRARPFGTITRFDFMLHPSGPLAGKPRGYAFISYANHQQALLARDRLSGAMLGGARLNVRWAHEPVKSGQQNDANRGSVPVRQISTQTQIRAIEAKLLNMDNSGNQLVLAAAKADVKHLPKVKGPLQLVNSLSRQTQAKPYVRKK